MKARKVAATLGTVFLSAVLTVCSVPVSAAYAAESNETAASVEQQSEEAQATEKEGSGTDTEDSEAAEQGDHEEPLEAASVNTQEGNESADEAQQGKSSEEASTVETAPAVQDDSAKEDDSSSINATGETATDETAPGETALETEGKSADTDDPDQAGAYTTNAASELSEEAATLPAEEEAAKEEAEKDAKDAATSGNCGEKGDNVKWSYADGTLTITGTGRMGTWKHGSSGEGAEVPWKDYEYDIEKVVIGEGITSIGAGAFANLYITSVQIPSTIKVVGHGAFASCNDLKNITLHEGLETIEYDAFLYSSIQSIKIPKSVKSIGNDAFFGSDLTSIVIPAGVKSLGSGVLCNCESLKSAVIESGLERIEAYFFSNCKALESVTIPSTIKVIDEGAFMGCAKLTKIDLPQGLKSIGEDAFSNTGLTSVTVPSSVTKIGKYAFPDNCKVNNEAPLIINNEGEAVSLDEASEIGMVVKYGQTEARKMLGMINSFRTSSKEAWYYDTNGKKVYCKGLSAIKYDYDLEQIAMQRAAEIALYFGHSRPDGTDCFSAKYNGKESYGENIAMGMGTAKSAFTMWQETDADYYGQGHRRNMLGDGFNCIGIGHVIYHGMHYWVQEFGDESKINTTATKAIDTHKKVNMIITNDFIYPNDIVVSPKSYLLDVKGSAAVPKASLAQFLTEGGFTIQKGATNPEWKSANNKIATVRDGRVVGVSKGTTYISAKVLGSVKKVKVTVGKLDTPKLTKTVNGVKGVAVKWEKVAGAAKYRVYRKTSKTGWKSVGVTSKTSFFDKTAKKGVAYQYSVATVTADGTSRTSDSSKTGISAYFMPKPAIASVERVSSDKLRVTWNKSSICTGYQINYAANKQFKGAKTVGVTNNQTLNKTIRNLQKNKTYFVRIRTYKKIGKKKFYSSWSTVKSIKF